MKALLLNSICIAGFLLIAETSYSQVGGINQKAKDNKEKNNSARPATRPSGSNTGSGRATEGRPTTQQPQRPTQQGQGGTANQPVRPSRFGQNPGPGPRPASGSSCSSCGICSTLGCAAGIAGITAWQIDRVRQNDVRPHITHAEVMLDGGFDPVNSTFLFMPRIRGAYGLFGGDLRFTHLDDGNDVYQTIDFQFLQINFLQTRYFDLRAGTGIKYEFISDRVFNEHHIGMDFHPQDFYYNVSFDARMAIDYASMVRTRTEMSLSGQYFMLQDKYYMAGPMFGLVYQNYYGAIDFFFIKAGFRMRFQ